MDIRVEVSAHYKWDVLPVGTAAPPDEVSAQVEFQGETRTAVRRLVTKPTFTTINVPDDELDTMFADHVTAGGHMTRHQFLARHLEDAVLALHAPAGHWTAVEASDPEAHAHLQNWVSQFGGAKPTKTEVSK